MSTIIPRATVIPAKKSQIYSTSQDYQTKVTTSVYEGERTLVKDNHPLGKFDMAIPAAPKGVPQIEVTFEIDENSLLTVSAVDKGTGKKERITITNDMGRLTKDQIDKMVADSEKFAEQDKKIKERIDSKHSMENYITQMKSTVQDKDKLGSKLDSEDLSTILEAIDETADWLNANDEADKDEIDDKLKELQSICDPIITKVYGSASGGDSGGESWEDDDEDFNEDL